MINNGFKFSFSLFAYSQFFQHCFLKRLSCHLSQKKKKKIGSPYVLHSVLTDLCNNTDLYLYKYFSILMISVIIKLCKCSNFVLIFQNYGYSRFFQLSYKFSKQSQFLQSVFWNFNRDCINCIDQLGNSGLFNFQTMNLLHSFLYLDILYFVLAMICGFFSVQFQTYC